MTLVGTIIPSPQLVRLTFAQDAVAASQTDVDLPRFETGATSGTTGVTAYEAPWGGVIVAAAATLSAAATAGTLTVKPTVAGTAKTVPSLSITTETGKTETKETQENVAAFDAGDAIGVQITTDASWDGTTADLGVDLYVVFEN